MNWKKKLVSSALALVTVSTVAVSSAAADTDTTCTEWHSWRERGGGRYQNVGIYQGNEDACERDHPYWGPGVGTAVWKREHGHLRTTDSFDRTDPVGIVSKLPDSESYRVGVYYIRYFHWQDNAWTHNDRYPYVDDIETINPYHSWYVPPVHMHDEWFDDPFDTRSAFHPGNHIYPEEVQKIKDLISLEVPEALELFRDLLARNEERAQEHMDKAPGEREPEIQALLDQIGNTGHAEWDDLWNRAMNLPQIRATSVVRSEQTMAERRAVGDRRAWARGGYEVGLASDYSYEPSLLRTLVHEFWHILQYHGGETLGSYGGLVCWQGEGDAMLVAAAYDKIKVIVDPELTDEDLSNNALWHIFRPIRDIIESEVEAGTFEPWTDYWDYAREKLDGNSRAYHEERAHTTHAEHCAETIANREENDKEHAQWQQEQREISTRHAVGNTLNARIRYEQYNGNPSGLSSADSDQIVQSIIDNKMVDTFLRGVEPRVSYGVFDHDSNKVDIDKSVYEIDCSLPSNISWYQHCYEQHHTKESP